MSVSEQNIDEILKEIGYNDSPLRREAKQAFAKWLKQEQKFYESFHGHSCDNSERILTIKQLVRKLEK